MDSIASISFVICQRRNWKNEKFCHVQENWLWIFVVLLVFSCIILLLTQEYCSRRA